MPKAGNPFIGAGSDLLIVSLDTLAGDRMFGRLQEAAVEPYDLVIFDEAHKLGGGPRGRSLASARPTAIGWRRRWPASRCEEPRWALSWRAQHLLLLTATPHMGKDYPYYCLWRLLEPDALSTYEAFEPTPARPARRHFIRRTKEEMVRLDGSPLYPHASPIP